MHKPHGSLWTSMTTFPSKERFTVYAIELRSEVLTHKKFRDKNPQHMEGKPCVYVGMTALSVEQRFANHLQGYKACRYARDYGTRLMPEIYTKFRSMEYKVAQLVKVQLAERLRAEGYAVWQD